MRTESNFKHVRISRDQFSQNSQYRKSNAVLGDNKYISMSHVIQVFQDITNIIISLETCFDN